MGTRCGKHPRLDIVFDLGGVVFTWNPEEIMARVFQDSAARDLIRKELFGHPDWARMDRGELAYPEAARRAAARTGLAETEIMALLRWVPLSLVGIPETIRLLSRLRAGGFRLFFLSNMHRPAMEYILRTYRIWDWFQGGVFSCLIGSAKPEPGIYKALLEKERLQPEGCVFIDDYPWNLTPAEQMGMKTILFKNAAQCEEHLGYWRRINRQSV